MLGFFFTELKQFVVQELSESAWIEILGKVGLASKDSYMNGLYYPDEDMSRIVVGVSNMTGMSIDQVLTEYGTYVGKDLFSAYKPLIDPSWKTLDFLEHVEESIHQVVRARNRKASPPRLVCNRLTSRELVIDYRSERKLCRVARGIALGVAGHYGEAIEIVEETCMHKGDPSCKIWISLKQADPVPGPSRVEEEEDIWAESDPATADNL